MNLVVQETSVPLFLVLLWSVEMRYALTTPQNSTNTYAWSWVGASGGTVRIPMPLQPIFFW